MTQPELTDSRITTLGLFAEAFSGLWARLSEQLTEHGLSSVEFEVLLRLGRTDGQRLRMSDLAAQVMLSTSGLTRVVDRLEAHGLVAREACPSDRRGTNAALTDAGRERLSAVLPGHLEIAERWLVGILEPTELDALTGALRKIRDAVRPCATAGAAGAANATAGAAPGG
jgi:MarR family 2-MHQ and catechol resistance regulon transcriptional repressor